MSELSGKKRRELEKLGKTVGKIRNNQMSLQTSTKDFDWFRDMISEILARPPTNDWENQFYFSLEKEIKEHWPLTDEQIEELLNLRRIRLLSFR